MKKHVSHFQPSDAQPSPQPLMPMDLDKAYDMPVGQNLESVAIAYIELGGGSTSLDVDLECKDVYHVEAPKISFEEVDGALNSMIPSDADGEVQLDECVGAAAAPGINQFVVFGPNSDQGFADAVMYACDKLPIKPLAISISWGGPEDEWDADAIKLMEDAFAHAASLGIEVFVASGDNGSSDGESAGDRVDYPAASNQVIACGGTRLLIDANGQRSAEKAWSLADGNGSTGGGYSKLFPVPDCQKSIPALQPLAGRGVPDISANADPMSGFKVKVDFINQVIGGTSAAAPYLASMFAKLKSHFPGVAIGSFKEILYAAPADCFFDVVEGNNGSYSAGEGFDLCTGRGVPIGSKLLAFMQERFGKAAVA